MSMKSRIRQAERSIHLRRARFRFALGGVRHSVGKRMVSPGALIAAGLFGAALHQDRRLQGLRLLALLEEVNAGLRLLLKLVRYATDTTRAKE
ncbi:hypothetical protein [Thioalkalivibrio sp. XN279]|uniref:hypothetical protein n=1 Tax=Thioalkalivibrio sp. XN279 TaxID=2714953 RepID=UPI00140B5D6E|nr:hypothetical protein [Thioalkalivibrio sp. XN279]NHA14643.1 hypothetical protein [Thioalkalivibrio sp. XN279]